MSKLSLAWPDLFLFVIRSDKKGSGDPPVQENRQKLSSVNKLLTSHKEVFNNLPLMYCRRDLMSQLIETKTLFPYTACLLVASNPNFSSALVM